MLEPKPFRTLHYFAIQGTNHEQQDKVYNEPHDILYNENLMIVKKVLKIA